MFRWTSTIINMKDFIVYINEKLKITKNILKQNQYNYYPKTKDELKELVSKLIEERGNEADLNDINTSEITDMSEVFKCTNFNGYISGWNVSNVTNMSEMFKDSSFNGNISKWDVSEVEDMSFMFAGSKFNGDISKWDVSNVKDMSMMFYNCENFDKDISGWNLKSVQEFHSVFFNCLKLPKNYKPKFNK